MKAKRRYAWCQNPRCWMFGKVVPIKHGTTMTCSVCSEKWPVHVG